MSSYNIEFIMVTAYATLRGMYRECTVMGSNLPGCASTRSFHTWPGQGSPGLTRAYQARLIPPGLIEFTWSKFYGLGCWRLVALVALVTLARPCQASPGFPQIADGRHRRASAS